MLLHENSIHIAMIQETKLEEGTQDPEIPGYDIVRKDRNHKGGGVATLVRDNLTYSSMVLEKTETLVCDVKSGGKTIRTVNFYLPPNIEVFPEEVFGARGNGTAIFCGDANGHHEAWFSDIEEDKRGAE